MNLNTLTTAAYLAIGFNHNLRLGRVLDHWDGGHLEITSQLMRYAPFVEALEMAAHAVVGDYPGVHSYEVTREFGSWYADQILLTDEDNMTPDETACATWLRIETCRFFGKLDLSDEDRGALLRATMDLPFELAAEA